MTRITFPDSTFMYIYIYTYVVCIYRHMYIYIYGTPPPMYPRLCAWLESQSSGGVGPWDSLVPKPFS